MQREGKRRALTVADVKVLKACEPQQQPKVTLGCRSPSSRASFLTPWLCFQSAVARLIRDITWQRLLFHHHRRAEGWRALITSFERITPA